jgi:hypothetical protein
VVVLDHIFVQPLKLLNKYLNDQDNAHFDDMEHLDYFLKHGNNDTSARNKKTQINCKIL